MQSMMRLAAFLGGLGVAAGLLPAAPCEFTNPIGEGADPWIIRHEGAYYWCQSEGNRGVAVYRSDSPHRLGEKFVVWRAPRSGPHSREIWAPELHTLDGKWYIYVAASNGENRNHRMIALEGDTPTGPFAFKAEFYTGDTPDSGAHNRWAIDGTVLERNGQRFFIWSGWEDEQDVQYLYIAPMKNPWTLAAARTRLCANNDYLWEHVGENREERGLHEAPQVWQRNGRTFLIYSCSGSWQPTYKWGMLTLEAEGDPLRPADWTKHPQPVFQSTDTTFGVGHGNITRSPDGQAHWITYHAKEDRNPGWRRSLFVQPFTWSDDNLPRFGAPVDRGEPLPCPSGAPARVGAARFEENFQASLSDWDVYGHHQVYGLQDGRLHLGRVPNEPINLYRSGEKALVRDGQWTNVTATVTVRVEEGDRDAGLLFRARYPAVGFDAVRGYFAGILPGADRVILGYMDGRHWQELARASAPLDIGRDYELTVRAEGDRIQVMVDDARAIDARDDRSAHGTVGVRVVNVHASFDDLRVWPEEESTALNRGSANGR